MKRTMYLLFVMAAVMIVSACSTSSEDTLGSIQDEGVVQVGFANERPYAYQESDGTITGQAVEIARAVFNELGVEEVEGTVVDFDALISGLNAGNFDAITAGMYITPERCENAAFAEPEYRIGEGLAVQAGNPHNLKSYEDIANNPDVTVTVMSGAIEREYLLAVGVSEDQIEQVNNISSNITALETGRTDAITMTDLTLRTALQDQDTSNIEIVEDFTQPVIDGQEVYGYGAAVFRHDDEELLNQYNEKLAELKESGRLLEIMEPFGFTEDNLPGDVTAAELCGASDE
ncbi:ectoine/hydroxyectoine ABC transporter substrate-binding protein EhuB [Halalkalibacterium ligniniphilum]|uniref:ectoine/hydroxyectoine ABC transporter substrate-binding protein EhuB n=1 Tax=Halalkalibacterium ligniniphilum TaxID=1134413 RepID=UPI0003469A55|nr:ectoine/hydroxyectoine ABC transporter substrate-binding protein EhuB [Halalkalibacterium ligniniphilum]